MQLYYKLRTEDDGKWWNKLSLEQRQRIHNLILSVYRVKNKLGGFSYKVLADRRPPTDRPIIFAPTHIGKFDIENISEAKKNRITIFYQEIMSI